jgi:hypothetical protein
VGWEQERGEERGRGLAIGCGRQCGRRRRAWAVVLEASERKLALALSWPTVHCRCSTERWHGGSRRRHGQRGRESAGVRQKPLGCLLSSRV